MNYDLKIHAHLNMAGELHSAFPGAIAELHIEVDDCTGSSNLLARFEEMCTFLGQLYTPRHQGVSCLIPTGSFMVTRDDQRMRKASHS